MTNFFTLMTAGVFGRGTPAAISSSESETVTTPGSFVIGDFFWCGEICRAWTVTTAGSLAIGEFFWCGEICRTWTENVASSQSSFSVIS